MELKIINEKENLLFERKEIRASIDAEITPSKNEVEALLVQKFSSQPENISLKGIHGQFGSKTFMVNANIYSSIEAKQRAEPKKKVKKKSQ